MAKLTGVNQNPTDNTELAVQSYASTSQANAGVSSGTILMYVSDILPAGYLTCDGSAVSRTTYANLFSAIGTSFGTGDGSTTFNLPNMKGRMPIGVKSTGNVTSLGATGGSFDHVHSMGAHTHTQSHTHDMTHTHTLNHYHDMSHTHSITSHTHSMTHSHSVPAHYHNLTGGSVTGASHNHTYPLDGASAAGSSAVRGGDNTGTTGGSYSTDAATWTAYSLGGTVGSIATYDGSVGFSSAQYTGTTGGTSGTSGASSTQFTDGGVIPTVTSGASSAASTDAYASATGAMTTSPNVSSSNPAFLAVNFIIKT